MIKTRRRAFHRKKKKKEANNKKQTNLKWVTRNLPLFSGSLIFLHSGDEVVTKFGGTGRFPDWRGDADEDQECDRIEKKFQTEFKIDFFSLLGGGRNFRFLGYFFVRGQHPPLSRPPTPRTLVPDASVNNASCSWRANNL